MATIQKTLRIEKIPQTTEEIEQSILGFTVTVSKIDRDNEVLDPATMDVNPFAQTGSLTLFHSHSDFPIGYPVRITAENDRIRTWIKFDVGEADDAQKTAETAYNKVLRGSFVNVSLEASPTPKSFGEIIETEDGYYVEYKYLELTGLSVVITPSNDQATTLTTDRERCTINDMREKKQLSYKQFEAFAAKS